MKALLLSNSTMPGTPFLQWPATYIQEFFEGGGKKLIFIPYAAVTLSFDEYFEKANDVFQSWGLSMTSLHLQDDKKKAVTDADGIVVGGGNTFVLLNRIYQDDLLMLIRNQVWQGKPYLGWSAGSNLACPTIMTTNDMPVVQPPSLKALGLIPFQLNPHYHELRFENVGGETRADRLHEFLEINPTKKVVGLPEGMYVRAVDSYVYLGGTGTAKLYEHGKPAESLRPGQRLQ